MLKRSLNGFFLFGFATYGVLWTVVESASAYFPQLKPEGVKQYFFLIAIACLVGVWRAWPKSTIEIEVPNSDSSIKIEFGDIFQKDGCIAIPVNEYFDSILGNHVSPSSLHGQVIQNILGSQSAAFDSLVAQALTTHSSQIVSRSSGNQKQYKIGTTAPVDIIDSVNKYSNIL